MEGNIVLASGNRQLLNSLIGSQPEYSFYGVQDVPTCLGVLMNMGGDVLLLDHDPSVPGGIDANEFLDELKKFKFVLPPSIALVSEDSLASVAQFFVLGGNDFVLKPLSTEVLKIRIDRVLKDVSFRAEAIKFRLLTGALEDFIRSVAFAQQQSLKQFIKVNVQCTELLGHYKEFVEQSEAKCNSRKGQNAETEKEELYGKEHLALLAEMQAANSAIIDWLNMMGKLTMSFSQGRGYFYLVMDELRDHFKAASSR